MPSIQLAVQGKSAEKAFMQAKPREDTDMSLGSVTSLVSENGPDEGSQIFKINRKFPFISSDWSLSLTDETSQKQCPGVNHMALIQVNFFRAS